MRKVAFLILLCGLISTAAAAGYGQKKRTVTVTGRAVDDRGMPVVNAGITLYDPPSCDGCLDHLVPFTRSFDDGVFFINSDHLSAEAVQLFVQGPVPNGFWTPFGGGPPYDEPLSGLPQFRAIEIPLLKVNTRIELNDVPVSLLYCKAPVEVSKVFAGRARPDRDAMKSLRMRVLDGNGGLLDDDRLPDEAFNADSTSLNLALPSGRWILEFSLHEQGKNVGLSRFLVNVDGCQQVSVVESKRAYELGRMP